MPPNFILFTHSWHSRYSIAAKRISFFARSSFICGSVARGSCLSTQSPTRLERIVDDTEPVGMPEDRVKSKLGFCFGIWSARARRPRFQRVLTQTDLLEPPGRRCGCWATSAFLFDGIVVRRFGATMEVGRSGRSMMLAGAGELPVDRARHPAASTFGEVVHSIDRRLRSGEAALRWRR
jgi:hypothetical protein